MVGEMRDRETAAIGIQAALTGHLVLTTLHTNSAADAVIRLVDMGIEPYLIASSLRGVIGQRLVRRLCERCRVPDPKGAGIARDLRARGGGAEPMGGAFHAAMGCAHCNDSGFRGRVGVFEALAVDDGLRDLIRGQPDPRLLLRAARAAGMTTMLDDGIEKASFGLTSLDEVMRISG